MFIDKELELIIFDLDGTLVNTDALYSLGWKTVLKQYDVILPKEVLAEMNGQSTEMNNSIVDTYIQDMNKTMAARQKREEFVIDALEMGVLSLKDGARELLDRLSQTDYRLALATSSPRVRGQQIVEKLDLADYFEIIIFGDEVKEKKPSPEIYFKVLHALEIKPEKAIAIEDSRSGVWSALDAGLEVVLVSDRDMSEFDRVNRVSLVGSLKEIKCR